MIRKIIFAMSMMILSAYAGDSFLYSCQKKWRIRSAMTNSSYLIPIT